MNPNKTKHLGELFHTIDYYSEAALLTIGGHRFKMNESSLTNFQKYLKNAEDTNVNIYNQTFQLTTHEFKHLKETVAKALTNIQKRIKLGI